MKMKKEKDVLVLEKGINPGFVIFFLVVLLLVGGGIYYYHAFFNNPSYIVKSSLKKFAAKNDSREMIDINKPLRIHGGIEFDLRSVDKEKQKSYDVFNNIELLYNIDFDIKNEILGTKINSKYEGKSLLNAKLYSEKNDVYIYLDDLYDKYIKIENESNSFLESEKIKELTEEELKILSNGMMKILMNAFSKEDFNRIKEEITINDKKVEVYKNYVVYNKDNFKKINEGIIKNLNESKEFTDLLKKKIGNDVYSKYVDKLTNLKDIGDYNAEFVVYTKGYTNKFVKMSLNLHNNDDYMLIEINNDDVMSFSIISDEMDFKVTIEQNDQNNVVFNFFVVTEDESNIKIKATVIADNIKSVDKINENNIISYDKLSEEEINKIMEKFSKHETINKFINDLSELYKDKSELMFSM